MAMNRAGLKSLMGYENGGGVTNEEQTTDTDNTGGISAFLNMPSVRDEIAKQLRFDTIRKTLESISPPPRRLTGYDLASSIGAGLLGQPLQEKIPSIGRGVGLGFQSFKQLSDKIRDEERKAKADRDLTAFGLAFKKSDTSRPTGQYVYETEDGIYREYATDDGIFFFGPKGKLSNDEFQREYPNHVLTDKSDIAGKLPSFEFVQGLEDKAYEEERGIRLLENYFKTTMGALDEEKGGGMGLNFIGIAFSRNIKSFTGNKNLTGAELDQFLASGQLQGLLGAMRKEVVGGGVMTEQDALRVINRLGGNLNALANPTLVAGALRDIYKDKYRTYERAVNKYNRVPKRGPLKTFEKYELIPNNEELMGKIADKGKIPESAILIETTPDPFDTKKISEYKYHDYGTNTTYILNSRGGLDIKEETLEVNPNLEPLDLITTNENT